MSHEHECVRRVLVAMMVADGEACPAEVETVTRVLSSLTGIEPDPSDLCREAALVAGKGVAAAECLRAVADGLGSLARRRIIAAAFAVASADGFLLDEEDALLAAIARCLGMSELEYRETLEGLLRV